MGKYTPNDLDPGAYKEGSLRGSDAKAPAHGEVDITERLHDAYRALLEAQHTLDEMMRPLGAAFRPTKLQPIADMWPIVCEARKEIEGLRSRVAEARAEWLPIETAPKDGTTVMLFCPRGDGNPGSTFRVTCGQWKFDPGEIYEHRDLDGRWTGQDERDPWEGWLSWDGGFSEETMMPTHWMPLPEPPDAD